MCIPLKFMIVTALAVALGGCVPEKPINKVTDQIDKLLLELDQAEYMIASESKEWRKHLLDLANKFEDAGAELLAKDLRQYTDLTIGEAGTTPLFFIDTLEEKVKLNLSQLRIALVKASEKVKKDGNYNETLSVILETMSVRLIPPEPRVASFTPYAVSVRYAKDAEDADRLVLDNKQQTILVRGYGFLRPSGESQNYYLRIVNANEGPRDITDCSSILNVTTPYVLQLNCQHLLPHIKNGDSKLLLMWGKDHLSFIETPSVAVSLSASAANLESDVPTTYELPILFSPEDAPVVAPAEKIITHLVVRIDTTRDDKDDGIVFTLIPHLPGVGGRGILNTGAELWENGVIREFTVKLEDPIPYKNRGDFMFLIRYGNIKGENTGWWGRLKVEALTKIGDQAGPNELVVPDTTDFKLGENGNPTQMEWPLR